MDRLKREQRLFATLQVPNDDVRNEAIMCVDVLPLSQVDSSEIRILVISIAKTTNLTAGQTEIMLAEAYNFLTRLALSQEETGKMFRNETIEMNSTNERTEMKGKNETDSNDGNDGTDGTDSNSNSNENGEEEKNTDGTNETNNGEDGMMNDYTDLSNAEIAITAAFSMLARVENGRTWQTEEDDAMGKLELCLSLVQFIQVCSACSKLKRYIESGPSASAIRSVLLHEHKLCQEINLTIEDERAIPITVERTWVGRKAGTLLHILTDMICGNGNFKNEDR